MFCEIEVLKGFIELLEKIPRSSPLLGKAVGCKPENSVEQACTTDIYQTFFWSFYHVL